MSITARPRWVRDVHRVLGNSGRLWWASFAPLAVLYLATARYGPAGLSIDVESVTSSAWALAHHGSARIPSSSPHFSAWMITAGSGHVVSNREPGLILLAALAYRVVPWVGPLSLWPASVLAALIAACAMATLAVLFSRLVSRPTALVAALVFGTATTTWSVSSSGLWPHGPVQLASVLALLAVVDRRYLAAGVALALGTLCRPPLILVAVVFAAWVVAHRRDRRGAAVLAYSACVGLLGELLWSRAYWGGGLAAQYGAVGSNYRGQLLAWHTQDIAMWLWNMFGALVSPGRGLLFGAPVLACLVPGARLAWRVAPSWVKLSAVAGLVNLLLQLKLNSFGGGAAFWSYRYQLSSLTLCAPLLLLAWREWTSRTVLRRAWFAAATSVTVSLQAVGALAFRRTRTRCWTFDDLIACVQDHPRLTIALLAGGIGLGGALWSAVMDTQARLPRSRLAEVSRYTIAARRQA